ncbi:MAG: hypothetical protein KBT06_05890, partial [Prevotellaceae bacterium]|nr:hypothetical protein [Candidatus Colivivens equi]
AGRIAAGMILYSEWVIYTAHLQKTSTETFMEIKGLFESPKLKKYVKEIKNALGREQIILNNGGRVVFVARTRNGGRGLHGDCLVFDEAQELTTEQQASFLPALAASKNPQTIYLGTPPDENCDGTVFRNIRTKALEGESKATAWTEYSVKEIGDVTDPERWARTNPALGRRIRLTTIESECEQMDEDTFARERLGWWSPVAEEQIEYAINKDKWNACKSSQLKPEGKTAYGVKFSPDGSEVYLCGAVIDASGISRISLIEQKSTGQGIQWLADWLNQRYGKACCVVIDGRNGVDVLVEKLQSVWKFKNSVIRAGTKDMIAAVSTLTNEISENTVTWYEGQEALNESAITSTKRPIGSGWGFGGEYSQPIEACSLALWGARNSKRNPQKKMRIG